MECLLISRPLKQVEANPEEMWAAQYDIKLSELVNQPNAAVDAGKFVTEQIYVKYLPPAGTTAVTLSITNAAGETKDFALSDALCGAAEDGTPYYGLCKDKYGAFTYAVPREGDYVPSHEAAAICEHAGMVGDTISWPITAVNGTVPLDVFAGSLTLLIRNNAILNFEETNPACTIYGNVGDWAKCASWLKGGSLRIGGRISTWETQRAPQLRFFLSIQPTNTGAPTSRRPRSPTASSRGRPSAWPWQTSSQSPPRTEATRCP